MTAPLSGVTVVELGTVIAGPFTGSLLADLGADIIKIEPPGAGDALRSMGYLKNGTSIWSGVSGRKKKFVSINLKLAAGKDLFKRLVQTADVLIENFRPGVLDRLDLGWGLLSRVNPRLIMLSISGFGHTGPKTRRPGFGKIAEGQSGVVSLTGNPGEAPLFVGFSLADTSTGLFGAFAIAVALYDRDVQGGCGSRIDLALYEPLFRMLDCQMGLLGDGPDPPLRQGRNDPYGWGVAASAYPRYVCVRSSAGDWLLVMIPDQAAEQVLADVVARGAAANGVGTPLGTWAGGTDVETIRKTVIDAGAYIAPVLDGRSIAANQYFRERGDVLPVETPQLGSFWVPGWIGRESTDERRDARFREAGIGEDNSEVLQQRLGLSDGEIRELESAGVI